MIGYINPYELNVKGTYEEPTDAGTYEERVTWAQKTGAQYLNMPMSRMAPRGDETYEAGQQVAEQRYSWKIMEQNRVFSKKGRLNVGGEYHYIEGVRQWKGFSNILVLDTTTKDNQL